MHGTDQERELTELEQALRSLRPLPAGLDRDELMFRAGQAARGRRPGLRLASRFLLALVAALVGGSIAWLVRPRVSERVVRVAVERPVLRVVELSPALPSGAEPEGRYLAADYLQLRDRVLAHGVDALPSGDAVPDGVSESTLDDLWREMGIRSPRRLAPRETYRPERRAG
jgi:hypothetical protein